MELANGIIKFVLGFRGDTLPSIFFPFAVDHGGNQYCLGVGEENYGQVFICYMDVGEIKTVLLEENFLGFVGAIR